MKTTVDKKLEITLILNEEEAEWLKAVVQNPIGVSYEFGDESEADGHMREKFFNAISRALG